MKLVPDWKDFWKWSSTHVAVIASTVVVVWPSIPHDVKSMIPQEYTPFIAGGMLLASFITARVRDQ